VKIFSEDSFDISVIIEYFGLAISQVKGPILGADIFLSDRIIQKADYLIIVHYAKGLNITADNNSDENMGRDSKELNYTFECK
jgi:hypothetical protein